MEVIAAVGFEVENVLEEEVCSAYGFSVHFRFYLFFFSLHSSLLRAMKRFVSDVSLLPRRMIYNAVYLAPRPVIDDRQPMLPHLSLHPNNLGIIPQRRPWPLNRDP